MPASEQTTTKIESLSVLLDPEGKMLLRELDKGIIQNIQTEPISSRLKNQELSGNPEAGTVQVKRFVNAQSANYGTARAAGKGQAVKGKPVTVPIDIDREFVEEVENKDITLLGVEGLLSMRSANHQLMMANELDEAFFKACADEGTKFTPKGEITAPKDIIEQAALTLQTLKTQYVNGVPRRMMSVTLSPEWYSKMRDYLETVKNTNITTVDEEFQMYHGLRVYSSDNMPSDVNFILQVDGSVAQPVIARPYSAERIPLSEAFGVSLFWYYGVKAITPELILVGKNS